jgi:hypothetical protein
MNLRNLKTTTLYMVLFFVLLGLSGCSVLTPSQVREAKKFAVAAENYDTLPGAVVEAHGELRKWEQLYVAAGFIPNELALVQIENALKEKKQALGLGKQADVALAVLNNYAQLLVLLTSDGFTADMSDEADDVGKRIDKGLELYNDVFKQDLSGFGGIVGGSIRGVGGIMIKRRQTKALRAALIAADPVIEELSEKVTSLIDQYLPGENGAGFILESERDLKKRFVSNKQSSIAKSPFFSVVQTADMLEYSREALSLAHQARKAIVSLRGAHRDLMQSLNEKGKLTSAIESVKVLSKEVKAASDLKDDLDH